MTAHKENLSRRLNLGFIGGSVCSAVGYTHFVSSTMDKLWKVSAGAFSRDAARNAETASVFGVDEDRVYGDWHQMIRDERGRLDAVVILTPSPAHFEMAAACIEAGYPVICEKALAVNSRQVQALQELRDRHHGFLAVTYNYSGYPMVRELRQLIRSGLLGQIKHFQVEMPQEGFIRVDASGNRPQPQDWRLHDGDVPTIYLDLGVHLHQLVHYLTGETAVSVSGQHASYGWFPDVVDNVSAICHYTHEVQGGIWFSKSALGHRNGLRLRIFGTEMAAEWVQVNPEEIVLSHRNGRREILDRAGSAIIANAARYTRFKAGHPAGFMEAFANIYKDIANAVTHYQSTRDFVSDEIFSTEMAGNGLRFLEAINRSATSGRWENVNAEPPLV